MTAQKIKTGRPRLHESAHYKALCLYRAAEVIAYLREGWSAGVATRKAGLCWEHARKYLMLDDEFVKAHTESQKIFKNKWGKWKNRETQ